MTNKCLIYSGNNSYFIKQSLLKRENWEEVSLFSRYYALGNWIFRRRHQSDEHSELYLEISEF